MIRKKSAPPVAVTSVAEADRTLREMGRLQLALDELDRKARDRIHEIKTRTVKDSAPLAERLKELEAGLNAFADSHRETLFAERRSIALVFGAFGWRKSTLIKPAPKGTWADILSRIKESGLTRAVRIREDVDRDELHRWSDEELRLVGARRMVKESFWYELAREGVTEKAVSHG